MKILIVRFSSIGDIVLTTPVVRCIKLQIPDVEIHFITKQNFYAILETNPHISKIHTISKSISEVLPQLKAEKFDFILDLHNNVRTLSLKWKLGLRSASFPKLNVQKWLLVNLKINHMPKKHIVDRYFEAAAVLGVKNDQKPCDFFLNPSDEVALSNYFPIQKEFVAFAIGAQFATKRLPNAKIVELLDKIDLPIILLGGKTDAENAAEILSKLKSKQVFSACGEFNLRQSASIVKQAKVLITHDTGLMHIASAFETPCVSIWGNTVPDLGMYPYFPKNKEAYSIHEVPNLSCRPCSKIGFQACPKKHFNCMNQQDLTAISSEVEKRYA